MEMMVKVLAAVMVFIVAAVVMIWLFVVLDGPQAQARRQIREIERAVGFKLYEWQREYILHGGKIPDNARGKTTAFIIRMLVTGVAADILIIQLSDVWGISEQDCGEDEDRRTYCRRYLRQMIRIWERLYEEGITVRNLIVRAGL